MDFLYNHFTEIFASVCLIAFLCACYFVDFEDPMTL